MAGEFDPADRNSWYFGSLTREETNRILLASEISNGVFLVRGSRSIQGDFVLCVREDSKVSHYIINKLQVHNTIRFRIGDQEFPDLPSLLNFYKTHYLDTTPLIRPAPRETYIAKFNFNGRDPEDLPFQKRDILLILQKDEDQWWTAKNEDGRIGQVPVPYIEKYDPLLEEQQEQEKKMQQALPNPTPAPEYKDPAITQPRKLPARAVVIQQRIPNAYDRTALRLEVGDEVLVTAMNLNGQWEGSINGRTGNFPFTHVRFIDSDNPDLEED